MYPNLLQGGADHIVSTAHNKPPTTLQDMQTNIRQANVEDLAHLVHHRRAMFEEMGYGDPAVLAQVEKSSREYFSQALRIGGYKAWLAEDANARIVAGGGIVIADWPGYPGETLANRAWILNMYTEPEARRHGLAKKLLDVMLDWCRTNGFRTVSLHASPAGRPLYESVGFQPTNEMRINL
jgi:GNAT superfamily N-acetyltransferase